MVVAKQEQVLILVKAFPQPSQKYAETVCCAGVNAQGEFVRLYPIRYRHLPPEKRFERWDVLEYKATHPTDDWRPESRHVNEDSIRIVQSKAQTNDEQRVRLWAPHVSESLSALKEENKATEKSLGIIRPDPGSIKFKARKLSPASEDDVQLQAAFKQVSLIEPNVLSELSVEYDFSYHFTSAGFEEISGATSFVEMVNMGHRNTLHVATRT